jgi:hypothetical protein
MDYELFFGLSVFIGIVIIFVLYMVTRKIQNKRTKLLVKIIYFVTAILVAFFCSIDGWKGNIYFQFFLIEFVLGIIIFVYGIFSIIKNRKMNLLIFSPFLLIIICFSAMSFGERNERKIHIVSERIKNYYSQNGNYDNKEEFFEYIRTPKDMNVIIDENNEVIIKYKNIIYYVNKYIMRYEINE